jgi:hypothetical protein
MSGFELIGALISGVGALAEGAAAKNSADFEADQLRKKGDEEFASSQRDAAQSRKEAQLANSRAQALAAASGGGAGSDAPTILKIMSDTAAKGEYNAQTQMYGGLSRRAGMLDQAAGRRASGKASFLGGALGAAGSFAKAAYGASKSGAFG